MELHDHFLFQNTEVLFDQPVSRVMGKFAVSASSALQWTSGKQLPLWDLCSFTRRQWPCAHSSKTSLQDCFFRITGTIYLPLLWIFRSIVGLLPVIPRVGGCYINTLFEKTNTSIVQMRIWYPNMGDNMLCFRDTYLSNNNSSYNMELYSSYLSLDISST